MRSTTTEECADLGAAMKAARRKPVVRIRGKGRTAFVLMTERRYQRIEARLAEVAEEERDAEEAARVLRRVHAGKERTYTTEELKRELDL